MTACKKNEVAEQSDKKILEAAPITFHHYFSGSLSGGINDMVESYNTSQSEYNLKVVPIDHEAYKVNIIQSLKSGTAADINSYWGGARTQNVVEYLEPLDDVYIENKLESVFAPSLLKSACTYNEHYYLVPITQHYVCFYYSKATFEKYQLEPPTNWNEFIQICETLITNQVTPIGLGAKNQWPAQLWFDYLLLRTVGNDYRNKLVTNQVPYTDVPVVQVMSMWKELIEQDYFNDNATELDWSLDIIDLMMDGKVGMTLMGTWLSSSFDEAGYNNEYGVFSFPIIDNEIQKTALGPIDGLIIAKDAINKEGAKKVLAEFTQAESQAKMAEGSGGFAPNLQVSKDIYDSNQLKLLDDIAGCKDWAFNYDLAVEPEIAVLGLNFFVEFLNYPEAYEYLLKELQNNIDAR